jgi:hypothetical protein
MVCHEHTDRKEVWSCTRDEGGPLASGDQELDANRCKLLPLRAVVVSVAERAGHDPAWVSTGETSASKPPMNCRNSIVENRTGISGHSGINAGGALKPGLRVLRLEGGVTPVQALVWNVGTCRLDAKVRFRVGAPGKKPGTDARHRDRVVRSRVEGAVMTPDRRGGDIVSEIPANR